MADTFDISLLPSVLDLQPKAHLMIGFGVTFLVLVWISVSTRIYVRLIMIRAFGWDDATLVMASLSFSSFCACLLVEARYCRSPEVETAYSTSNPEGIWVVLTKALTFVVIYNALYILTTILFKISLSIFFLRIVVVKWQRRLIYISTGFYTLYSIIFIFLVTFRCGSPPDLLINAYKGSLNAATDVIFATLPIFILWNSHMPRRAKTSAGVLLSMGCLGSIASIIRIAYLGGLSVDTGFFKHAIDAGLLSVVEPGLAITAASLSALRPLFKSMVEKTLPSFFHTGYGRTKHSIASNSKRHTSRSHRATRPRTSFDDQKGFQVFDNTTSRTQTIIATSPRIEMDEFSNDCNDTLHRASSQGSLVEQHMYGSANTWVPPYSGKGVMMTRAINVTEH